MRFMMKQYTQYDFSQILWGNNCYPQGGREGISLDRLGNKTEIKDENRGPLSFFWETQEPPHKNFPKIRKDPKEFPMTV